jgi:transcriptional regulator with XRE-family HTH domain
MTAGQQLAAARRGRRWSREEIAARLQVSVPRIAAVENTDIGQLPSRNYLRDLVSEYALEVGLDPQQMEGRYLAELDALPLRPHDHGTGASGGTADAPPASRHESAATRGDALSQFAAESTLLYAGLTAPDPQGQQQAAVSTDAAPAAAAHDTSSSLQHAPQASRPGGEPEDDVLSSLPLRLEGVDMPPIRDRRRRSGLRYVSGAGAGLVGLAALLYLGGVDISHAGSGISRFVERLRDRLPRLPHGEGSGGVAGRSAEPAPPGDPLRTGMTPPPTPPQTQTSAAAPSSAVGRAVTNRPPATASVPPVDPPRAAPAADSDAADQPAAAPAHDVSGPWHLTNHVESTDYSQFSEMTLGFELILEQQGTRIAGHGYKSSENGMLLQSSRRTPIALEGHLQGERLVLTFIERGRARTSAGRVVLHVADDGSLRGRFTSDAARSSGSSIAIRQPSGV